MDVVVELNKQSYILSKFFPVTDKSNHKVQINQKNFFVSFDRRNQCFFLSMEGNKSFSKVIALKNVIKNNPKQLLHQEISFKTHSCGRVIDLTCDLDYPNRKRRQKNLEAGDLKVFSPISGTLVKTLKTEGSVKKNELILVIDAMKLENKIVAPKDGNLKITPYAEGSQIKAGDLLFTIEA